MMGRMAELLTDVRYGSRATANGHAAQLVSRVTRRLTDPIVLAECRHDHRTERAAIRCAAGLHRAALVTHQPGRTDR